MKSNRRNRKLKFIREKNKFRTGSVCIISFKISSEIRFKKYLLLQFFKRNIEQGWKSTATRLKIPKAQFSVISFEIGWVGDDFVRDVATVRAYLKIKR